MAQKMIRAQHYAVHADGKLAYAGSSDVRGITATSARAVHRAWVAWARGYVAENPGDYPLRATVAGLRQNPIVRLTLEPIGEPGQARVFELRRPRGTVAQRAAAYQAALHCERHAAGCPTCTARSVMRAAL